MKEVTFKVVKVPSLVFIGLWETYLKIDAPSGKTIIVENDFCHSTESNFRLPENLVLTDTSVSLKEFCPYFGIKSRVYGNYQLLIETFKEEGFSKEFIDNLPKWN